MISVSFEFFPDVRVVNARETNLKLEFNNCAMIDLGGKL